MLDSRVNSRAPHVLIDPNTWFLHWVGLKRILSTRRASELDYLVAVISSQNEWKLACRLKEILKTAFQCFGRSNIGLYRVKVGFDGLETWIDEVLGRREIHGDQEVWEVPSLRFGSCFKYGFIYCTSKKVDDFCSATFDFSLNRESHSSLDTLQVRLWSALFTTL